MSDYAIVAPNEDGETFRFVNPEDINDWNIEKWMTEEDADQYPWVQYWPEGSAMLLKVEIVVPREVTKEWQIP